MHTEVFDTRKKDGVPHQETVVYLSTMTLSAADATHAIRVHWGIENPPRRSRYDLGRGCQPHPAQPHLFVMLRSFALNLPRFNDVSHISLGWYDNTLNFDRLLAYQGL